MDDERQVPGSVQQILAVLLLEKPWSMVGNPTRPGGCLLLTASEDVAGPPNLFEINSCVP